MDKIRMYLVEISDRLEREVKTTCVDAIDELVKTSSLKKVAQYVGVIGYVLKQERAMSNCIRKKRAASSSEPMQEIVLGCLKECTIQGAEQMCDPHLLFLRVRLRTLILRNLQ